MIDENDKICDLVWFKGYTINLKSLNTTTLPLQSQINIYTDSSKTEQHVGAGFAIFRGKDLVVTGSRIIPYEATVFQAEVMAIQIAMMKFNEIILSQDMYIKLLTDSQATLLTLNSHIIRSQLVKDTISALNLVGTRINRLELN